MARGKLKMENPQQIAQKWANGYAASGPSITAAMNSPSLPDPTALAIAQQSTLLQNFTQAVSSGRWAGALRASGKQGYVQGMLTKTVPSVGTRATAGMPHVQSFWNVWGPQLQQMVQQLPARGTYDQNKQRAAAMMDAEHAARGRYRHVWAQGQMGP